MTLDRVAMKAGLTALLPAPWCWPVAVVCHTQLLADVDYEATAIHVFGFKQTAKACVLGRIITLNIFWAK